VIASEARLAAPSACRPGQILQ